MGTCSPTQTGTSTRSQELVSRLSSTWVSQTILYDSGFIDTRIQACLQELLSLESKATALRKQHLGERLKIAKRNNDIDAIKAITRIIKKECQQRDWSTTNYAIKGPGMHSVCAIQVTEDGTTREFTNKESLEENGGKQINKRYTQSYSAPHLLQLSTRRCWPVG